MGEVQQAAKGGVGVEELKELFLNLLRRYDRRSEESIQQIAEIGARRLRDGDVIMTHSYSSSVLSDTGEGP